MARFKFGKSKRKDAMGDTSMSLDDESLNLYDKQSLDNQLPQVSIQHPREGANTPPVDGGRMGNGSTPPPSSILRKPNTTQPVDLDSDATPWMKFKLQNSPFPRYRHSASTLSSEKNEIFLMGGLKEGSVFGDTWKIRPDIDESTNEILGYSADNVIIANNNNPPARVGHSSVLIGNAFIIYGGDTVDTDFNGFPDNNFYLFNVNNNKYTIPSHILNKPNGRYGHTIAVVSLNNLSSRLYLFGGQLENDVFNDLYYFELNTFKSPKARWEAVEPLNNFRPPPLTNHSMSVYKNRIYVFGGVYNNEKVSNDLWCFDIPSSKWTQVSTSGNIPLPVNEHSACIINDRLFVYGGNDFSGIIYNSLYVLDLHTLAWSKLISNGEIDSPGPRCGHTMSYIPNLNKIVIMGGDKNDYVSDDMDDFNTYETKDPNVVLNTMIYQLDLNIIDPFLSSKQTVVKSSKKAAAAARLSQTPPVEGIETNDDSNQNFGMKAGMGAAAGVGAVGAGAAAMAGMGGSRDDMRAGFERHGRSFSAGPDDFRTPEASPERERDDRDPTDKFVEVPSSTISEREVTEDELDDLGPASNLRNMGSTREFNGHSRQIEDDRNENNSTPVLLKNAENEKVKQLVNELTAQLNALRTSTKSEMQNATEQINRLESENKELKTTNANELKQQVEDQNRIITELKQQIDPNLLRIAEEDEETNDYSVSSSITELTKYKLERLDLHNKLTYLTKEHAGMNKKVKEFEPFMDNQIGQLSNFQKIIQKQEEKIRILSGQVRDQEHLHKEINDWKTRHDNLELEFNNYRSLHDDDDISEDEEEGNEEYPTHNGNESMSRSMMSNSTTKRSKKEIASHLQLLVTLWNQKNISGSGERELEGGDSEAVDPLVLELQKQLDDLMKISKEQQVSSTREISNLQNELQAKLNNIRSFESNYKDALQSVNNTSKALNLTQDELTNQKTLMEKLIKENNELKLFKKASKRTSSRNPLQSQEQLNLGSPAIKEEGEEDDDDSAIETAHYNMKLKDLEADLYILKQERDQLKENVTSLQKQLYLAQTSP